MRRSRLIVGQTLAVCAIGAAAVSWAANQAPPLAPRPPIAITPISLLTAPIADGPKAAILRHGQDMARAGDCVSCHMGEVGEPLAGGLGLQTPFGVIFSSNITPDPETGIGQWTADQFYRAMHDGHGAQGEHLYPAFPYPWFRRMSRADDDALFEFIKTTPPIHYTPPANHLIFPLNFRFLVGIWNLLFLDSETFVPQADKTDAWNRGNYLVNGPGHCGACHTPKNLFGADKGGQEFHGGVLDNWTAPDLTANARVGLGGWSAADIVEYLKTGRNSHAGAGGAMADVVMYSTSLMSDADRAAMATYLKSIPASPTPSTGGAAPDQALLSRGAAIYSDACASCHLENGVGQPDLFPPLSHDAMLQQTDPTGLEHLLLAGTRIAATPTRPSPLSMPSFAWKLSDQEIADVATYLRNTWGNQAPPVDASSVTGLRKQLRLERPRYTDNSGDQK